MLVRAVSSEEVGEGTERTERSDSDKKLHLDLRSQLERSQGAPCENEARQ
jgi:hypothetical protein